MMMSSKETGTPGSQLSHFGDLLSVSTRQCWVWNTHMLNNTHLHARPRRRNVKLGDAGKRKWNCENEFVVTQMTQTGCILTYNSMRSMWLSAGVERRERTWNLWNVPNLTKSPLSSDCTGWITERRSLLHINSCIHCSHSLSVEAFLTRVKISEEKMSRMSKHLWKDAS